MLWRAEVQRQAAQEELGFPREIYWRSSQGRSLLSRHGTARLALPGEAPGQDMAPSRDPTSSLPPSRQLRRCSHTAKAHLSPRPRAALLSASGSPRAKGFLCLLRGGSALPTADGHLTPVHPPNSHGSAPAPAGSQQIRVTWPWALAKQHPAAPDPFLTSHLIERKSNTLGSLALTSSASTHSTPAQTAH